MNTVEQESSKTKGIWSRLPRVLLKMAVRFFLPLCILAGALGIAKYHLETKPKAQRSKPPRQARLVTVEKVQRRDTATMVEAMGTVMAARQSTLSPEVSGKIVKLDSEVVPGGIVNKGQELVKIDPRDYQAIVERRRSELAQAQMNLRLEEGNQDVAIQEYRMLDTEVDGKDKDLVLRKPQLKNATAAVEAAKANLKKALHDVNRCSIEAPFNGIIQEKHVDVGAVVSPSSSLVTVTGTNEYWIEALVPVDKLRWIDVPRNGRGSGSVVKIYERFAWGEDTYRTGRVLRMQGELEDKGRMAKLLVSVKDPLCLSEGNFEKPPLLINSYVRMEIEGRRLENVIPVDRAYVHNGNEVWVMNGDNKLEVRGVDIMFSGENEVYVNGGLEDGARVVTTNMSAPVEGMMLRVDGGTEVAADVQMESIEGQDK